MSRVLGLVDRLFGLDPTERGGVLRAAGVQFVLLTAFYCLRPLRDALSVSGGVGKLPWLFTATFLGVLAITPLFGFAVARLGRARLIRVVYRVCALVLVCLYVGLSIGPHLWSAYAFFVWISVFNMFALSLFWSVMADRHGSEAAKRVFGPIFVGASLGALCGPLIAGAVATFLEPPLLLLLAAVLFELALRLGKPLWGEARPTGSIDAAEHNSSPSPLAIGGNPFAGLVEIFASPRLLAICGYLLLMTSAATVLYFQQGALVEAARPDEAGRTQLLSGIDLGVNALSLAGQAFIASRVMRRGGVQLALVVLPIVCAIGFGLLSALPSLAVLIAVQVARRASNYALSKPAREVLYTGVSRSERYKAKSVIDTLVYRGGDAAAGWAYAAVAALGFGMSAIALAMIPLSLVWVAMGFWLGRAHAGHAVGGEEKSEEPGE